MIPKKRVAVAWQRLVESLPMRSLLCDVADLKGLVGELGRSLVDLRSALENLRDDIARSSSGPRFVTVTLVGHVLLDDDRSASRPVPQMVGSSTLSAPPLVTTLVGAKTVTLAPSYRERVVFNVQRVVRHGALVWVYGPGLLESVVLANEHCVLCSGLGPMFVVPRTMLVGQELECTVVGVRP